MRKLSVLVLSSYPTNDTVEIGPEAAAYFLAQGIRGNTNIEYSVATISKRIASDHEVKDGNITILFLSSPRPKLLTRIIRDTSKLLRYVRTTNANIVHAQGGVDYGLAALLSGRRWVYTVHGHIGHELKKWAGPGGPQSSWNTSSGGSFSRKRAI